MANTDVARGLVPVRYMNGAPWNGAATAYVNLAAETEDIFIGQGVSLAAEGSDASGKYAAVTAGTVTSSVFVGVMIGRCNGNGELLQDSILYCEGGVTEDQYLLVVDDPQVVFEIQEVSGGTALVAADVGLNVDLVETSEGSTRTGLCGWELQNVGEAVTATFDVKILNVSRKIDNALGEHCKWDVRINRHQYVDQTLGI